MHIYKYSILWVVCVSPLTSIMMDQRARLSAKGIATEFVGEAQLDKAVNQAVVDGKVQLVFIIPENLLHNPSFRGRLTSAVYKEALPCSNSFFLLEISFPQKQQGISLSTIDGRRLRLASKTAFFTCSGANH